MTATHIDAHHDDHHHDSTDTDMFGFWLYIMSDCLIFASLFATFAVMGQGYANAVRPQELFNLTYVLGETTLLLFSSFTFGVAMLAAHKNDLKGVMKWLVITLILGLGFLGMEINEFMHLAHEGATPQASGYWTAFFSLVGTHGLHVTAGSIWMVILFFHFKRDGLTTTNKFRLACLSLFWHFLDVIWICVFSFVFLLGVQ
ncbi:MAG: cytochrome o ubiquinol oxidase subunit III [Gammaproteobacteria bacterium]|nr:MAG: cytochrome o ubiquinol oxidase subunit III [Gammaproteobacteria bacterium]